MKPVSNRQTGWRRVVPRISSVACGVLIAVGCHDSDHAGTDVGAAPPPEAVPASTAVSSAAAKPREGLLAVGQQVPDIAGVAHNGRAVRFRAMAGKPLVVYFYPKDETPGCTIEAEGIRDSWKQLEALGAVVVGVSADDDASHRSFAKNHKLPFLLLADTDHAIAHAFGVPVKNGKDQRVTFIVDKNGKIAKVFPAVDPRGHPRELMAALSSL